MNHFITTKTGFHPVQLNDFAFIQQAYQQGFDAVCRMMLPDDTLGAILSGCSLQTDGVNYLFSDGFIYYHGEIYLVLASSGKYIDGQLPCLTVEESYPDFNPVEYFDKSEHYVHQIRVLTFSFEDDATGLIDYDSIARVEALFAEKLGLSLTTGEELATTQEALEHAQERLELLEATASPLGSILMIDSESIDLFDLATGLGSAIYKNWALCDGRNNTPDLRGRFIAGYDPNNVEYDMDMEGGEEKITLDETEMPVHSHEFDQYQTDRQYQEDGDGATLLKSQTSTLETSSSGGLLIDEVNMVYETQPHENRPPFYTLAFIKKIA